MKAMWRSSTVNFAQLNDKESKVPVEVEFSGFIIADEEDEAWEQDVL